mmetsp:Transcript_20984/g.62069  ORF Transcript_20984/g.62069 Transcript_20984/m.62069 type:complete len:195 (+) Transcript_20984:80-664(+)
MMLIPLVACAFTRHAETGKFMPDDFNVTEIEEREKWESTRPHIKCGVCRLGVMHALDRLHVASAEEDELYSFFESVCEAPDAELYDRYMIAEGPDGQYEAVEVSELEDTRRVDIRKWHSLSMRDVCTFTIQANDDKLVEGIGKCRGGDKAETAICVCLHASQCTRKQAARFASGGVDPAPAATSKNLGISKDEV